MPNNILREKIVYIIFFFLTPCLCSGIQAQTKPWVVPASASGIKSPLAVSDATLKDAKTLYTNYCSPCHGDKGKGDGIAAAALSVKPADYTSDLVLKETDGNLFYKMSEGRLPMPQFKTTLTENQRWELVAYIRTLNKSGKK